MYKYCIVPECTNTTFKTPEKLFLNVPKDPKLRKEWFSAVKRNDAPTSAKATRHCCEDHFDVEKDMDNYIKFKLVGGRLKVKKGVLPHKFECQKPQKQKISKDIGQEDLLLHSIEVVECENQESNDIQNSDPLNIPEEMAVLSKNNESGQKTQAVQVNMKPEMITKSTNTPIQWTRGIVKRKNNPKKSRCKR